MMAEPQSAELSDSSHRNLTTLNHIARSKNKTFSLFYITMYRGRQSKYKSGQGHHPRPPKNESADTVTSTSEIVEQLKLCAQELEEKQDRHERIVKVGRDITIDSKRLIFYLHTFQKGTPDAENILAEAETRLIKIVKSHFNNIYKELKDLDVHQYTRAFTYGVQEFIEAFSFYHYLVNDTLLTFNDVEEFLTQHLESSDNLPLSQIRLPQQCYFVTMIDYVLGVSDLTGELMRYCINQVAAGRNKIAFDTCRFLTNLYTGMLGVACRSRDYNRKMYTFVQSVRKVEMACYTVKVRGTEMPKHMIFDVLDNHDEPDEMSF